MEWVKLHLDWANGLEALTDENDQIDEAAAGRWILGLLQYVRTGEKPQLSGPEKVLFAMAVADLKKDYAFLEKQTADAEAKRQAVSEARRGAANARWNKEESAPECNDMQTDANVSTSMQEQSKPEQTEQFAAIRSKNIDQDIKNTDIERDKEKNKKRKRENANGAKSGKAKDVTEAQYDQRPNTEPDGNSVPQWLQDYESEITGYSDPAGNADAPDRPDIHSDG